MSNWFGSDFKDRFEMGGEIIPDNTVALAALDEVKWDEYRDGYREEEYISVRWSILQPDELKGRKVFQKLKVSDPDEKKRERQRRMLAAIDLNAGGNLTRLGEQPSDNDLQKYLLYKPMLIKVKVWEMDGKKGNWVCAVSPRDSAEVKLAEITEEPKETFFNSSKNQIPF
mgnify:CR=1 FL=1